jgi:ribosomal protein S1
VSINARVRVKVLAVDAARNRISLSMKQAGAQAG